MRRGEKNKKSGAIDHLEQNKGKRRKRQMLFTRLTHRQKDATGEGNIITDTDRMCCCQSMASQMQVSLRHLNTSSCCLYFQMHLRYWKVLASRDFAAV